MRSKKAFKNIIASLTLQAVSIISGLIIPGLIISSFGSTINGLIAAITQFLGYITLMEAGVGGVTRAALYKPLAEKDNLTISSIIKATEKFFKSVGYVFIVYLIIIAIILPKIIENDINFFFIFTLVIIMGFSTFSQYFFGITYQLLLQADQKQYVILYVQTLSIILNTVLIVFLINLNVNIHLVQLMSASVFVLRPLFLNKYVNKNYDITKECEPDNKAIEQRWDGLGHHIANTIHNSTDVILITLFSNIKEVSVYSIYYLVVSGVRKISVTIFSGIESAFGNMLAKDEKEVLNKNFNVFEFLTFTIVTILFTSTAILIIPFISIYTTKVTDVNYIRPVFAYILLLSEAVYCIRIPYSTLVLAAGHYKQTRNGAFVEAGINIILSSFLIYLFGITGVAIGTFVAMLFRTLQYVLYLSSSILKRSIYAFFKKLIIYSLGSLLIIIIASFLPEYNLSTFLEWIIYAIFIFIIACIIIFLIGVIFYKAELMNLYDISKRIFRKNKVQNK